MTAGQRTPIAKGRFSAALVARALRIILMKFDDQVR
jgi:hypothetical protein